MSKIKLFPILGNTKKLNEVYYTTNAYYDPAEGPTPMLMQFIVPNLYGTEYEWAQSI